jgi:hypothetical protein
MSVPRPMRRPPLCAMLLALGVLWIAPAAADDRAEFRAAIEQASLQYHIALRTLEADGREQTAAEVRRFRQAWGEIIERFGASPPFADENHAATLMDVDVRVLGALIVIDIGSRDAAREALKPIGATLEQLWKRAAPQ